MSQLDRLFGGGNASDPMNAANKYLDQIPGVAHQGFDPYVNAGRGAMDTTKSHYEDLLKDPAALINKLMESYHTSNGFNFEKDLLQKEMRNTANAGGIAGTPTDQFNQAQGIQGLLSRDMQQFLANALGLYHTGLQGEEGIANRGYNASQSLTDLLTQSLNQKGGLAFNAEQAKQQKNNDLWKMFGKGLGVAGGTLLGGPAGGAIGGALGSSLAGPMSGSSTAPWQNPG